MCVNNININWMLELFISRGRYVGIGVSAALLLASQVVCMHWVYSEPPYTVISISGIAEWHINLHINATSPEYYTEKRTIKLKMKLFLLTFFLGASLAPSPSESEANVQKWEVNEKLNQTLTNTTRGRNLVFILIYLHCTKWANEYPQLMLGLEAATRKSL